MQVSLELNGVTKLFAFGDGVREVDLTLARGEIHALVGLNGAGKSTLMRLMLGMKIPDSGTVRLDGVPFDRVPLERWMRVGHLIEYPLAYPELTTRQNLLLSARLRGLTRRKAEEAGNAIIEKLNLNKFAGRRVGKLSLGNRQRVGLAAALQHEPDLIILDEPTNALDPAGVILLRNVLLERAAHGATVLVSSHHLDEVSRISHRITVINGGRIIGALEPGQPEIERAFFSLVQTHSETA
ncbi:ABC transporter ATP-binding protein [Sphingomonas flavalba]|uniref:ABC transporter ATP-binding protein n=1 Tax=Sphingomonas flavalba TaxID=2559804 RepID=UPI00109DF40A|nr:ABC transporter ATP-binding protein [Sphingomonas flavalba]